MLPHLLVVAPAQLLLVVLPQTAACTATTVGRAATKAACTATKAACTVPTVGRVVPTAACTATTVGRVDPTADRVATTVGCAATNSWSCCRSRAGEREEDLELVPRSSMPNTKPTEKFAISVTYPRATCEKESSHLTKKGA